MACNTVVAERQRKEDDKKLRKALRTSHTRVNTSAPPEHYHVRNKKKRKAIIKEKNATILHENKILIQKMLKLDSKAGRLNKEVLYPDSYKMYMHNNGSLIRNYLNIVNENRLFLNKLLVTRSNYNIDNWARDRRHTSYLINNISQNSGRLRKASMRNSCKSNELIANILLERASRPKTAESANRTIPQVNASFSN